MLKKILLNATYKLFTLESVNKHDISIRGISHMSALLSRENLNMIEFIKYKQANALSRHKIH